MKNHEKIIRFIASIIGFCSIAGGFLFFIMVIVAMVNGQITIGAN
jgi:hypothetical protein